MAVTGGEIEVRETTIGDLSVHVEEIPYVETTSLAFLVRIGSAHEGDSQAGISHFLEHVSFRGTKSFSMRELKYKIESVGGTLNAFTTPRSTVYYAKIPSFQLEDAMKVLGEIVFYPLIKEEDVDLEKKIILEEIRMTLENPEERLYRLALRSVWKGPFGRDTLGSEDTVKKLSAKDIKEYHDEKYIPGRIKLVIAGNLENFDEAVNEMDIPRKSGSVKDPKEPSFKHNDDVRLEVMKDINHVHVLLLKEGLGKTSGDYEKMMVLDTILGSGMSSYLFEMIRERLGTVYEIYSFSYSLKNAGVYGIYFSTSPENVLRTLDEIRKSLVRLNVSDYYEYGIKRRLGKFKMSMESPSGVLNYMVDKLVYSDEVMDPKSYEKLITSITSSELRDFSEDFLSGDWSVFAVAPEGFSWDICKIRI